MNKWLIGCGAMSLMFVIMGLVAACMFVSIMNQEVGLRNTITAKQKDNENEYDAMWKKISQVAQVTNAQKEALKEIFVSHAQARTGNNGGAIMKWVQESCPNVDTTTFNNLQNIITSSRDRFVMRQKELIDFKREHDNLIDKFPSKLICSILGKNKIEIQIVTSTRSDNAFKTGKDDDVTVFESK